MPTLAATLERRGLTPPDDIARPTQGPAGAASVFWLVRWYDRHATVATVMTLVATAVIALAPLPALSTQLLLLAVLLAVTGLPHGAADHLPARGLFAPQFGRLWPLVFGAFYLSVAAFVLVAWLEFPPATLTLFLLLAVQHFGSEDAPERIYGRRRRLPMLLHGLIPVAGPVLFHGSETALLFAWLLPGTSVPAVERVLAALAPALPVLVVGWVVLATSLYARGGSASRSVALEIVALVLLMALAPPLLAFGIYFCGWHSVRHMLGEAHVLDPKHPGRGLLRFARHAAPVTLASILLGALAYAITASGVTPDVALTRVLFIGLAAIAVPHIVLRALRARR
jgi:Brp/Blh family beta-carotene 15,15'-monooxygenase